MPKSMYGKNNPKMGNKKAKGMMNSKGMAKGGKMGSTSIGGGYPMKTKW